jgi:hypothetical protein
VRAQHDEWRAGQGDHAAREIWRGGPPGGGAHAKTAAAILAHLFGGLSLRRFRGFALSGGFGEAIGAVAGQSLLGETMLFALMFRRSVLRCFTHFSILPIVSRLRSGRWFWLDLHFS